jgi:hypothetical protein
VSGGIISFYENSNPHLFDLAKQVHYYQAWLTTISLIVGHLYNVVFNPDIYPLNRSFLFGTLSEEEMTLLHARELDSVTPRSE